MNRIVLLLALLLAACSSPEYAAPFDHPDPYWFPEGHPLYEAQQTWGIPLAAEFPYEVVSREVTAAECGPVEAACPPGGDCFVAGCTQHSPRRILVVEALVTPARLSQIRLHELGHIYHGPGGHVTEDCPKDHVGPHVMCAWGAPDLAPTHEDYDFVLRSGEYR